jgi:hypothetical protein
MFHGFPLELQAHKTQNDHVWWIYLQDNFSTYAPLFNNRDIGVAKPRLMNKAELY